MRLIYVAGSGNELMTIEGDVTKSGSDTKITHYRIDFKAGRVKVSRQRPTVTARGDGFTLRFRDGRSYDGSVVVNADFLNSEIELHPIRLNLGEILPRQMFLPVTTKQLIVNLKHMRRYAIESRELFR